MKKRKSFKTPKAESPLAAASFEAYNEAFAAKIHWPAFNSAHEGFSVLKEEVDELWRHVMMKQHARSLSEMRKEALQVAAMALRFASECCDERVGRR